jgi:uncharacterized protein YdgA (DUF945 family)
MQQQAANPAKADVANAEQAATPVQQQAAPAVNPADAAQQATVLADKQLASMVQSGILSVQGNDYVVEMSFTQGQLTINGKLFNPAMLKFQ